MVSGLDAVREQIRVAAGEPLGYEQNEISFRGFSIEGRLNAEDPAAQFRPAPGTITAYREPAASAFASTRRLTPAGRYHPTTIRSSLNRRLGADS